MGHIFAILENANSGANRMKFITFTAVPYLLPFIFRSNFEIRTSTLKNWGGGSAPLLGRGLGPHLTQTRLGWGLPPYRVASWCIQPFGHNRNGRKWGGGLRPLCWEGRLGLHLTQSPLSWGQHPSGILMYRTVWPMATIEMGRKLGRGALPPFFLGGGRDWGLPPCQVPPSFIQPFGRNKHGPKIGGGSAPFWREERGPHLTQSRLGRGLAPYQCKAVTGLATFSARIVIYLMLIRHAGT